MANCVCDIYVTAKDAETAIELIDDAKFLGMAVMREAGTNKDKILVVKKA